MPDEKKPDDVPTDSERITEELDEQMRRRAESDAGAGFTRESQEKSRNTNYGWPPPERTP